MQMYQLLILEDEQNIRNGLVFLFPWHDLGFEIAGAFGDGSEALEFVRDHPVDALLTDIILPKMNGLDTAREILQLHPQTQVVFLTGYRNFSYAHEAIQMHACNYLLKPVKYEELVPVFLEIRETLDKRNQAQANNEQEGYYRRIITQVKKHVTENLRTASLESAALCVNLSTGYLSRLFKECVGTGFSEYCTQARMHHAALLLVQSDMRTYEISDEIGYDNPKNFTRAFKKYFGISPREYRIGNAGVSTTEET